MSQKEKCLALAKEHGLEVIFDYSKSYHEINLPESYQLEDGDDRTGLCNNLRLGSSKEAIYRSLWTDLEEIISYKPWLKV